MKDKPSNWTGKTWASQQGYLKSKGKILLFTDADTYYSKKDVILQSVLYMRKEDLDVLTGIPSSEKLRNFWSKITIPMWNFICTLFSIGSAEVNDPKSKIAYLMGSFFLIKRKVFINIGTFESVHDAIQEDKALGTIIKESGYNMRLVKLKDMVYTIWADDLLTLWHGIGRTIAPLIMNNKLKVILNLNIIFFCSLLPFILLPFTISIIFEKLSNITIYEIPFDTKFYLFVLNLFTCINVYIFSLSKCKEYKVKPIYSIGSPFASAFVIAACLYNIIPLLTFGNTKPILWQGRQHVYKKEQRGFTI